MCRHVSRRDVVAALQRRLSTQEIYAKEETFRISSPSTLEEDHEARQESRHAMNMTPNDLRTEASTCKSSGT
jgi:hypothetical protein